MRLYSVFAVAVATMLGSGSALANHRVESIAANYHESVHVVADYVAHDRHASPYLMRYLNLLDHAADDFLAAVIHDPYCPRTLGMFEDLRSLHHRVESLLGRGCRTLPAVAVTWGEANHWFVQLDRLYGPRCSQPDRRVIVQRVPVVTESSVFVPNHRLDPREHAIDGYQLDRRRFEFQQRDHRNLNNRNLPLEPVFPQSSRSRGIERLLMGILN